MNSPNRPAADVLAQAKAFLSRTTIVGPHAALALAFGKELLRLDAATKLQATVSDEDIAREIVGIRWKTAPLLDSEVKQLSAMIAAHTQAKVREAQGTELVTLNIPNMPPCPFCKGTHIDVVRHKTSGVKDACCAACGAVANLDKWTAAGKQQGPSLTPPDGGGHSIIVFKSGEYTLCPRSSAWEFENDKDNDYLCTIPLSLASRRPTTAHCKHPDRTYDSHSLTVGKYWCPGCGAKHLPAPTNSTTEDSPASSVDA